MAKKVLITGGFGYLGGRIAIALFSAGYQVRLASRRSHLLPIWLPEAEMTTLDIVDPVSCRVALEGINIVVHLAALNEHDCMQSPENALKVNVYGTKLLLDTAIDIGIKTFIYISTAHVYGTPLLGQINEKNVPHPIHPYAITHHIAENFIFSAHDKNSIIGIVLRLSNAFGAATHPDIERWSLLVNDLCRQIFSTGKIILYSNGLQERDFITLEDVGRAIIHVLNMERDQHSDGLYNLGGDLTLSVWQMTQKIIERCRLVFGFKPDVERKVTHENDAINKECLTYDSTKIKNTGFQLLKNTNSAIDETLHLSKKAFGLRT